MEAGEHMSIEQNVDENFNETLFQVIKEDEDWDFSQRLYYSVTDDIQDHYTLESPMNKGKHNMYTCYL